MRIIFLISFISIIFTCCSEEPEFVSLQYPYIEMVIATSNSGKTILKANVVLEGNSTISSYGFMWYRQNTSYNPFYTAPAFYTGIKLFNSQLTGVENYEAIVEVDGFHRGIPLFVRPIVKTGTIDIYYDPIPFTPQ